MNIPEYIKMSEAVPIVDLPQHKINGYVHDGAYTAAPETGGWGKARFLSTAVDLPVLIFFSDLLKEGFTVRHAGRVAARLKGAMDCYPEAALLSLVTLENGSTFALPTEQVDISTGYNSGAYIRTALIVDARNLKRRVEVALSGGGNV